MPTIKNSKIYLFVIITAICASTGLHVWATLFDNFGVNIAELNGAEMGMLQSIREIPGFLCFLIVYILLFVKEHKLCAFAILLMGTGLCITGFFPSFYGLAFTIMLMSTGFHFAETTTQSLVLQYFKSDIAPLVLGRMLSAIALSNIICVISIIIVAKFLDFKLMYLFFGGIIVCAGIWAICQDPSDASRPAQSKKMVLKTKYWLYYMLSFMAGARRQIFVAFAVFLLVLKFKFTVQEIAILFLLNNLINYFLSPYIGKSIIKFGERKVLSLEYLGLVIIFTSYAFVESKLLVSFLYILDHIFFNFAIALRTFFQKVANPEDIAPSMAVTFTINHIAAIFLPALGGAIWIFDYRIVFLGGAAMGVISLILVQFIPSEMAKLIPLRGDGDK
ncbi:MAG: MFS transporter [Desulfotalea sp.]